MRTILLLVALFVAAATAHAQFGYHDSGDTLFVMSYNVENLFHPDDDPNKNDDAFTPTGNYRWTMSQLRKKSAKISRVISSANGWQLPHIVGLSEVEGEKAVDALLDEGGLAKIGYKRLCYPTPDRRGIAVAMLYHADEVKVLASKPFVMSLPAREFITRDVLYAKIQFRTDTFHIMVNHWPSKYGGEQRTEWMRNHVAQQVRNICDSIEAASHEAKIIILGDFNDGAAAPAIAEVLGATTEGGALVNLSRDTEKSSYKYHGEWNTIDHIIVSKALCRSDRPKFVVCDLPFLLEEDLQNTGVKPFRTFVGSQFIDGYSDHLPVMVKIPMK